MSACSAFDILLRYAVVPRVSMKSEGEFYYLQTLGDMSRCCKNCGSRSVIVSNGSTHCSLQRAQMFFPENRRLSHSSLFSLRGDPKGLPSPQIWNFRSAKAVFTCSKDLRGHTTVKPRKFSIL
ncbi:hypothetical protein AVEN_146982-1 [Araneus ventricosus]|uniref:Uncharacterized protein n=1 Tax=Araneus ventricosus TaxID=182803 RepID=A0A4Y2PMW9_ARAVE|nr:hypothetical protein AVEN_146982-1 [Araneus ventricosus]